MKRQYFGGADKPLRAADLRNPSDVQMAALARFFEDGAFYRIAVLLTSGTELTADLHPDKVAADAVHEHIRDIGGRLAHPRVALLAEASLRTGGLAGHFHQGHTLLPSEELGWYTEVPFLYRWMTKEPNEPILEVADFIAHAAGVELRTRLRVGHTRRRDYRAVFAPANRALVRHSIVKRARNRLSPRNRDSDS